MKTNEELFRVAQKVMPGGVSSPVRAFRSVSGIPPFISRGIGDRIIDEEGREFIDLVGSWGPLIAGHAHPDITRGLSETLKKGTSFGASCTLEIALAEQIIDCVPSIEMVRFVNSGTEATMSAIRLARGYTGRKYIIKFNGCYHGHSDGLLIKAGSGATTLGVPDSPGVPEEITSLTIPAEFNDIEGIEEIFSQRGQSIAAVIVEPVAGNMGVIPPAPQFLETLRKLCSDYGALFIFDEVMTGFRVAKGGAQERFRITPDLTCLGKVIGGGLPVGAYGGPKKIMELLAPVGPVYQAGTLSGNPLAMAAGIEMLKIIRKPGFYEDLTAKCNAFYERVEHAIQAAPFQACLQSVGAMATLFFHPGPVQNYTQATQADKHMFSRFFHFMLEHGVYFPPSPFEAFFISSAHSDEDLSRVADTIEQFCHENF